MSELAEEVQEEQINCLPGDFPSALQPSASTEGKPTAAFSCSCMAVAALSPAKAGWDLQCLSPEEDLSTSRS